ncbi:MAG: thioredoxin domain-containing protein, partial [Cyclobacteriaceae bacterium]|nr:thioredoxin domain-containing protein [Cyclobacteriaceae bacterium]
VYACAYKLMPNDLYKTAVYQTVEWLKREMISNQGAFNSALDADSEGVEGKFYVWTEAELKECLKEDYPFAQNYYNTLSAGNWEHGWNILHRKMNDVSFAKKNETNLNELNFLVDSINHRLLEKREARIRPGLDDKILTSWNALMSKGLLDAYDAFGGNDFLDLAIKNIDYLMTSLMKDEQLYHSAGNKIKGFMDDYALVIEVLIAAYQVTFEELYLVKAKELTEYCLTEFYDQEQKFFYYTSRSSESLIADKKEIHDNVIPASNSIMSANLLTLGVMLDNEKYSEIGKSMVSRLLSLIEQEPRYMTNWATSLHKLIFDPFEIIIVGKKAIEIRNELAKHSLPNHIFMGTNSISNLPLIKDRIVLLNETTIYVCRNKTCQLPVTSIEKALTQLSKFD